MHSCPGLLLYLPLTTVVGAVSGSLMALALLLLVLLYRLPVLAPAQGIAFTIPGAPWVFAAVLMLTIALLVQALPDVTYVLGPYYATGGCRHCLT